VSKDKFPKGTASANSWAVDIWRSWAQKQIFVSRTIVRSCSRAYDFTPEIGLLVVVFTALHGMQTLSSDVCPSVCLPNT